MMFFKRELRKILDERQECRGRYELVLIPKNGSHKIADILVKMQPAAEVVVNLEASWHNQWRIWSATAQAKQNDI